MFDLKKEVIVSERAIKESLQNKDKLQKLSFLSEDTEYWKEQFSYQENRNSLKNFLLYKSAAAFGLYEKGANDADITPTALRSLKERLYALPCVETVKVGKENGPKEKDRLFYVQLKNGNGIYLESDTANSLMTDLGAFFKILLKRKWGEDWPQKTYFKEYGLDPNRRDSDGKYIDSYYRPFRYFYFSTLLSNFNELLESKEDYDCYKSLMWLADLTHTCDNMVLVPYGHNAARGYSLATYRTGIKIKDRLDLTIQDFEEMKKEIDKGNGEIVEKKRRKELKKNNSNDSFEKFTAESVTFLLDHKEDLFSPIPVYKGMNLKEVL